MANSSSLGELMERDRIVKALEAKLAAHEAGVKKTTSHYKRHDHYQAIKALTQDITTLRYMVPEFPTPEDAMRCFTWAAHRVQRARLDRDYGNMWFAPAGYARGGAKRNFPIILPR